MKILNTFVPLLAFVMCPSVLMAAQSTSTNSSVIPIPSSAIVSSPMPSPSSPMISEGTAAPPFFLNSSTYLSLYGLNVNNTENNYLPFYEDLNFKYPV